MEKEIFRELADVLGSKGSSFVGHIEIEGAGHALQKTHCAEIAAAIDRWTTRAVAEADG